MLLKLVVANVALVSAAAAFLVHLKATQRLGAPGVKATQNSGSLRMEIQLPSDILNYRAEPLKPLPEELGVLPKDTSIARTRYSNTNNFIDLAVVLMGTDRTSIHQPQFCLKGQGWQIDQTEVVNVPVRIPSGEEMPVMKLTTTKQLRDSAGKEITIRGIFVYWFVAKGMQTPRHGERMWRMAKGLLQQGELQRWAYVTCFCPCFPGQEELAFDRVKQFLTTAVPQFQTF